MNKELFEQARAFAQNLLDTQEGKKYQETKYILEGDEEALNLLTKYRNTQQEFQLKKQSGENLEQAKDELLSTIEMVKANDTIAEFFKAESTFNEMVTHIMDIFNATLTCNIDEIARDCCSGGCGGCSGCH